MRKFIKPVVVLSQCLEFGACRYNGQKIPDSFVRSLKSHVQFKPVCPEVEIGLGVPRLPIRMVAVRKEPRLVQSETGKDVSEALKTFSDTFLGGLKEVDGFILKSRSPSCGIKDVKIYSGNGKGGVTGKGSGFFGGRAAKRFPGLAIEDEGRLLNLKIQEHFLTRLFTLAEFRQVKSTYSMSGLILFQKVHKYLLMVYSQKELKALGQIVANQERKTLDRVLENYEQHLKAAFEKPPRPAAVVDIFQHLYEGFSERLSSQEKKFFQESVRKFQAGKLPLAAVSHLLKSWVVRFNVPYLEEQSFFEPYPEALVHLSDSGKTTLKETVS